MLVADNHSRERGQSKYAVCCVSFSKQLNGQMILILKRIVKQRRVIAYLAGSGNYTYVHFFDAPKELYAQTLGSFANELPEFVRVHKGYLVNPDFVTDYRSNGHRKLELKVGGHWLPVSRRRLDEAEILFVRLEESVF